MITGVRFTRFHLVILTFCLTVACISHIGTAKVKLILSHHYGTDHPFHLGYTAATEGFMRKYPDYEVEVQPLRSDAQWIVQIAAGTPPDVFPVVPTIASSWALKGLIQPLDIFVEKFKVPLDDFVPPQLQECMWDEKLWVMPLQVDPNFALVWNKDLFDEAGLDPKIPPKTLRDFEDYFKKLTRWDSSGKIKQIGMVPWEVYTNPNTMWTWGWIFGGEFYDFKQNRATAHNQHNVDALTYLREFYLNYINEVQLLNQGLPTRTNRFTAGREAMRFMITSDLANAVRLFPDLKIAAGPMFYRPESGNTNPAWVGGWGLGIPVGAKNPEASWKLIHYLTADPEGVALFANASGKFPSYLKATVYKEKLAKDLLMSVYMKILLGTRHCRPSIPAFQTYDEELNKALPQVFAGKIQPKDALKYVSERVDTEMAKVLREFSARIGGR